MSKITGAGAEHLRDASEKLDIFYKELDDRIHQLGSGIERYSTGHYIGYRNVRSKKVRFLEIKVQKDNCLRILMRSNDKSINDPKGLLNKSRVPETHLWSKMTDILMLDPNNLNKKFTFDDVMNIIEQSFKSTL